MGLKNPGFENSWLKSPGLESSWFKNLGLKGPGLKLGVEKSGVEMSFNRFVPRSLFYSSMNMTHVSGPRVGDGMEKCPGELSL